MNRITILDAVMSGDLKPVINKRIVFSKDISVIKLCFKESDEEFEIPVNNIDYLTLDMDGGH